MNKHLQDPRPQRLLPFGSLISRSQKFPCAKGDICKLFSFQHPENPFKQDTTFLSQDIC